MLPWNERNLASIGGIIRKQNTNFETICKNGEGERFPDLNENYDSLALEARNAGVSSCLSFSANTDPRETHCHGFWREVKSGLVTSID